MCLCVDSIYTGYVWRVIGGSEASSSIFLVIEVIGTVTFAISGVMAAARASMDWLGAIVLAVVVAIGGGTITGVGGGVLRDILTGNKPIVLVGQVYALAGIAGAALFVVLIELGVNPDLSVWLPMAVIFGIRMLSIRRDWHLPKVVSQA